MPIKIAGIITLGIAFIGLLLFVLIWFDRKWKQQEADRKQRLEEKAQNDKFTLELFDKILRDQSLDVMRLVDENEELRRKIKRMEDTAAKCKLKNLKEEE